MTDETREKLEGEIEALKQLLRNTDYMSLKHAEGALSDEEFAETAAQRQAWRDQINDLEDQIGEA